MKKFAQATAFAISILTLSGCTQSQYNQSNVNQLRSTEYGTIISVKTVQVQDDWKGKTLGALAGGLIGTQFGKGNGRTVATLAGAAAGAYAGHEINSDTAEEVTIRLNNENTITTLVKKQHFYVNQYVVIISIGDKIKSITPTNRQPNRVQPVQTNNNTDKFPASFEVVN